MRGHTQPASPSDANIAGPGGHHVSSVSLYPEGKGLSLYCCFICSFVFSCVVSLSEVGDAFGSPQPLAEHTAVYRHPAAYKLLASRLYAHLYICIAALKKAIVHLW